MDLSLEAVIGTFTQDDYTCSTLAVSALYTFSWVSFYDLGEGWMGMSVLIFTFKLALNNFCAGHFGSHGNTANLQEKTATKR